MTHTERLCLVLWDEWALQEGLHFDEKEHVIRGYEDFGEQHGTTDRPTDHCLNFLVRSLDKDAHWKFLFSYYLVSKTCPTDVLVQLIVENIENLFALGLRPMASCCDQASTNWAAINKLIDAWKQLTGRYEPVYLVQGEPIVHFWDTPHLGKNLKNNWAKTHLYKSIAFEADGERKHAYWDHVVKLYENDRDNFNVGFLTKEHIEPQGRQKMHVKLSLQVLSSTVG